MNALDAVLARAQPGYQAGVEKIVDRLRTTFGSGRFDGLAVEQLADILTVLLEHAPVKANDSEAAAVIRDLLVLEWWCGLSVNDGAKSRLARLLRRDYRLQIAGAGLKRPRPDVAARRSHVVFVGSFESMLHSPSVGAAGYLRALAADPKNRKIEVYHYGAINPELGAYMRDQLPRTIAFHQIEEQPDYLAMAVMRAPCTYHFWCYPRPNIDYSFMAMFGPTVMFTCADDAPVQHADVYWSCRPPEHIQRVWTAAPASFRSNYEASKAADFQLLAPIKMRTKAHLGLAEGDVLMATIGNRLGVDLDEAFVTGVEKALRRRPNARWLVVGVLPDPLKNAMGQVLGHQFLHMAFEPDLGGLMSAADLCLNPFRRGGGNSAIIAASAGAPVLTRGDLGDVGACVPAEHWAADADDYFIRLDRLLDDAEERAAWAEAQKAFLDAWLDKSLYAAELDRMVALAFKRFQARAGRSLDVVFPDALIAAPA